MARTTLPQLTQRDLTPYITVGTDYRGSTVWLVIDRDMIIECMSGHRAIAVLEHMIKTKHR
jgi:hypothetical protein